MRLLLTNNTPSIDTLRHLPRLPLDIDYSDKTSAVARKDEDNIHLGLQHHDRVHQVFLRAPSSSLRVWLEVMNKPFPRLGDLSLLSTTTEKMSLVLPETLQAPDLRRLSLHGIGLPTRSPLLSSTTTLSTLSLTHIGASCYLPPGHLVIQLQGLPHLEELSIGFAIPIPLPSGERELLSPPIPPVTLPALKRLSFRGVSVYLDNLVAQIHTPLLERLNLTLFFELDFTLVNLNEFIRRTEGFGCLDTRVIFNKGGVSIDTDYFKKLDVCKCSLHVNCEPLDWQIDSATQVCSALAKVLSATEDLTLDLNVEGMPSDWENKLDSMPWHELLLAFTGVKKLHIGSSLAVKIFQALESVSGAWVLQLLPELQELEVPDIDHATKALSMFMETRDSVGRPIHLLAPPIPYMDEKINRLRDHYSKARPGTEDQRSCLKDLVRLYNAKISQTRDTTFIDEAIKYNKRLLALTHPTDKSMFFYLSSFASFLYSAFRFSLTKRAKYLDDSIALFREVFQLDDAQHSHFSTTQRLIECLNIRWQRDGRQQESPDLDEVMDLFASGVKDTYAMVPNRFDLACHWANTARISGHHSLSTAYENAKSLMQSSLVFAPTLPIQYTRLVEKRDLYEKIPLDYASHLIHAGQLERAIEVLEHGRAKLWSEMRGLRTSTDRLRAADPGLADRFTAINQELEKMTTSALSNRSREINDEGEGHEWMEKFSALMKRRHKLLTERDALIPQIRSLPGLENFLSPLSFDTLRSAASHGPVIIINHCEFGSDIIIVLHNSPPSHISMPSDFFNRANKLKDRLLSTRKQYGPNSRRHEDALFFVLTKLYELVGLPVVKRLDELGIAEQSRVWWCPTSVFWDLPLHAMGPTLSDGGVKRYFSDIYISSYTPTLSALLASRRPATQTSTGPKLLVSQPGQCLSGVWADTQAAQGLNLRTTILISENTTPTSVLDSLQCHQVAHISDHVTLETAKPFDTAMSFHSGKRLTLLDIVRSQHPTGECALLLGSHTAGLASDSIPDEVLHFSAAMQYSGFRSVIGTLWEVDDEDEKDVAGNIYRSIFSGGKGVEPYYERSARALQHAVQKMRRDLPLARWVNYVHYGA